MTTLIKVPRYASTNPKHWTPSEDALLRDYVAATKATTKLADYGNAVALLPRRNQKSIRDRAIVLELVKATGHRPTAEDNARIVEMISAGLHLGAIVAASGSTHRYIHKIAAMHGLAISGPPARPVTPRVPKVRPVKARVIKERPAARIIGRATAFHANQVATAPQPQTVALPVGPEMAELLRPKGPTATSSRNTWQKGFSFGSRIGRKVARTPELMAMIESHIARHGVSRPQAPDHERAILALRRRDYIVVPVREGWAIDHRHVLPDAAAITAFAKARGLSF